MRQFFSLIALSTLMFVTSSQLVSAQNSTASPAATNQPSQAASEAAALFQNQKWDEAATAYAALTKTEPTNGQAWYRLGASLSSLNKHEEAVAPLQKAVEILRGPMAMYMLGSTYAKLNNKEKAFESLSQAAAAGFGQLNRLQNDPSLANLRNDPRYKKLVEDVERTSRPCVSSEKAREFDFWLGTWDVQVNGSSVGTNVIEKIQDGCAIVENWTGQAGQTGKGINFYNPTLGTWRQTYVGNRLAIWEMSGEYKDGAMRYSGKVFSSNGQRMTRVTFYNLPSGRIRHTEEHSSDEGKTWTNVWDATYIRKATGQ